MREWWIARNGRWAAYFHCNKKVRCCLFTVCSALRNTTARVLGSICMLSFEAFFVFPESNLWLAPKVQLPIAHCCRKNHRNHLFAFFQING